MGNYLGWGMLVGFVTFIGVWIYALTQWGLLIGLMGGWLPAIIAGVVAGILWPLVVGAFVWLMLLMYGG